MKNDNFWKEHLRKENERVNAIGEKFIKQLFARPYILNDIRENVLTNTSFIPKVFDIKAKTHIVANSLMETIDHKKGLFSLRFILDNEKCPCEDMILLDIDGVVTPLEEIIVKEKKIQWIS